MIRRLAALADAPAFVAEGIGGGALANDIALSDGLEVVSSIRRAALLIVAGRPRPDDIDDLQRLHDQMPHPRATLWARSDPIRGFGGTVLADGADFGVTVRAVWAELLSNRRRSEPDILPNEPPNPWRGVGPHGQGGKGMMGGTPYGRPMAMLGEDARDGMALDAYSARFGPYLPALPAGLSLELTLQGDVIERARVCRSSFTHCEAEPSMAACWALARIHELVGLPDLARRLRVASRQDTGQRSLQWLSRLRGGRRAVPPGLARIAEADGVFDARERVQRLWAVAAGAAPATAAERTDGRDTLGEMLIGLEWTEAMVALASLEPFLLPRLAQASMKHAEREKRETDDRDGNGNGEDHGNGHEHHGGAA